MENDLGLIDNFAEDEQKNNVDHVAVQISSFVEMEMRNSFIHNFEERVNHASFGMRLRNIASSMSVRNHEFYTRVVNSINLDESSIVRNIFTVHPQQIALNEDALFAAVERLVDEEGIEFNEEEKVDQNHEAYDAFNAILENVVNNLANVEIVDDKEGEDGIRISFASRFASQNNNNQRERSN